MLTNNVAQFIVEFLIVYLLLGLFFYLGGLLLKSSKHASEYCSSVYSRLFYQIISGLFVCISLYAMVVTRGITINILVLPLCYFLFWDRKRNLVTQLHQPVPAIRLKNYIEIGFIVLLSLVILHVFPVDEYKQSDGFFYLKIAEAMNASGQENISHYFNLYNTDFNGTEPYHYFEIWITAFIIRLSEGFLPSILVERYVTQSILLASIILGLYMLSQTILKRKPDVFDKIFFWSLLFIFPNLLGYFPKLYQVFVSDFEGNMLDRPNFRIIYLLLIPLIDEMYTKRGVSKNAWYWMLLLAVVSFQFTIVFITGLLLYCIFLLAKKKFNGRIYWQPVLAFSVVFAAFYWFFSVKNIPSFFKSDSSRFLLQTFRGYKFIFFSIVTSVLYILLITLLLLLPLIVVNKSKVFAYCKDLVITFTPLIFIGIAGILLARILYLKDNAYQFIFITHILITLFVWLVYLHQIRETSKPVHVLSAALYISLFWVLHWVVMPPASVNIFRQNGAYVYEGKKYSENYLSQVNNFFDTSKQKVGGYLADTLFYNSTYYSRRNPNIYFLPLTYIMANKHNRIIDFCLSDSSAIKYNLTQQIENDYLDNAISRSLFFRYRSDHPSLNQIETIKSFITNNRLSYLIVTKDYPLEELPVNIRRQIIDTNTGERFLIL